MSEVSFEGIKRIYNSPMLLSALEKIKRAAEERKEVELDFLETQTLLDYLSKLEWEVKIYGTDLHIKS